MSEESSSSSICCGPHRYYYDMLIPPQEGHDTIEEVTTYHSENFIGESALNAWSSIIKNLHYIGYDKTNNVYSWYSDTGMVTETFYYDGGSYEIIYGDYLGSDSESVSTIGNVECYVRYYPDKGIIDIDVEHYPDANDPWFNNTTIASYSGVKTSIMGILSSPECRVIQEDPRGVDGLGIYSSGEKQYTYGTYEMVDRYTLTTNNGSYILSEECCPCEDSSSSSESSSSSSSYSESSSSSYSPSHPEDSSSSFSSSSSPSQPLAYVSPDLTIGPVRRYRTESIKLRIR